MTRLHQSLTSSASAFTLLVFGVVLLQMSCGGGSTTPETPSPGPPPQVMLSRLSSDTFTNPSGQHATEVEPSAYANGATIVTVFQVGRNFAGGASDIGYATSTNGGTSWTNGLLPGLTIYQGGGTYSAVSDAVVVYDKAHAQWLVASLGIGAAIQVLVSRSPDGQNWSNPTVVSFTGNADKPWIACDNTSSSPYYGHCYMQWDDPDANGLIWMSTSADGGITWSGETNTVDSAHGIGGQPVVQPNGNVVVPLLSWDVTKQLAFTSNNGGATWNAAVTAANVVDHAVAGGLRNTPLPSATIDASGRVYLVWQDCRFRTSCSANDMVLSTSTDGATWTTVSRVPIDDVGSGVDHFIPGLTVDPTTSGASAHLGISYYYYSQAACASTTCQLNVGFIASHDGGTTWTAATLLAGPMSLGWLPTTSSGSMVADYIATAYANGNGYAFFAVARANNNTVLDQAIYTTTSALPNAQQVQAQARLAKSSAQDRVVSFHSDHPPRHFEDVDESLYPRNKPHTSP